ncbi:MAG: cytochrome c biogenesis protein CcsA [Planctomycetaceae bacterium]|nr:cytochrome c biogenesis protein CcsA [Planctomycetaceae bacterium]
MNRIQSGKAPIARLVSEDSSEHLPSKVHSVPKGLGILNLLASLRLTVILLVASVFMIWVATLQQVEKDIWDVKKEHFPSPVVYIPLYTFFPPAWLPDARDWFQKWTLNGRPVGLLLPSGFSIIVAMIVNLISAHLLRFRIQGTGLALQMGVAVTSLGIGLCSVVVVLGQSTSVQALPLHTYPQFKYAILGLMAAASATLVWWAFRMPAYRSTERILAVSLAALMLGAPALMWSTGNVIDDSGMRILWQISQCSVASLVVLIGLKFIFKRKAGIVLLHGGFLLLLLNEIWVVTTHVEQRISGVEGETVSYSYDIRDVEMALIQRLGEEDRIITVPRSLLERAATKPEQWYFVPETDLQFRVLSYFQNSALSRADSKNPATAGIGVALQATAADRVSGVSQNDANMASAYVQFRNKSEQDLGTFLITQAYEYYRGPMFQVPNVIKNGDQTFVASMWFKRDYKPYTIEINDVQSKNYPGTMTPQWYATEFTLNDAERQFSGDQRVWMNNPLRYRDETFYQSGYNKDPATGVETTTLQVVLNRGWMIPYLCCAMVTIGLIAQFLPVMMGYLDKSQRATGLVIETPQGQTILSSVSKVSGPTAASGIGSSSTGTGSRFGLGMATAAAVLVGLLFIGWGMPKRVVVDELNLDGLAQIPVSYKGRNQPLDSLAQTMLRKTSGLEAARSNEETLFGKRKYPATRWLADWLFESKPKVNYEVFRIDNRQILDAMKLYQRSGFRYTWNELEPGLVKLQEMERKARDKVENKDKLETLDKVVLDVAGNIAFARMVQDSLSISPTQLSNLNAQLFGAAATQTTSNLPGVIPGSDPGAPWLAPNVARMRLELERLSTELDSKEADVLVGRFIPEAIAEIVVDDPDFINLVKQGIPQLSSMPRDKQQQILARVVGELLITMDSEARANFISSKLKLDAAEYIDKLRGAMRAVAGGPKLLPLNEDQKASLQAWDAIGLAYIDRDQAALDSAIERYLQAVRSQQGDSIAWNKISAEHRLNGWSPFYLSSVMYLFAAISAVFAWFVQPTYLRRFTWTFLFVAFLIHSVGMIARIYISGRAPVTSIYSSALAIAWGMVFSFLIIELYTKRGVANFMGGIAGFLTLLVAYGLSLSDDTFAVLQAVLDTQFWLWTHVTIIALGYILTMVAGFWAIWMIAVSWLPGTTAADRKSSADITYGLIAAATILSFLGTVLGGLWADDSWGRFWGWDPKENGAAMIVLWNAAILHARWAGLIRFQGLAAMAIFGNVVTAWSWFAVNELGVGLHSYGFTEGVVTYLTVFWLSQLFFMLLTLIPPSNRGRNEVGVA